MLSMYCVWLFLMSNLVMYLYVNASCKADSSATLHRNRRQLLFPNSTLLQLNGGVATPTPIKTIFVNWAFQANFQLPWNRTQIPLDILNANTGYTGEARKRRDLNSIKEDEDAKGMPQSYENDARLYHFYKYVEDVLNRYGHNGTACVLRALCQLGAEPIHSDDEEDLLHELMTFVLNPTNDITDDPLQMREAFPYIDAYKNGQKNENCINKYSLCSISVVDMFTKLYEVS